MNDIYHPRTKEDLAKLLVERFKVRESQKPENQGLDEEGLSFKLYSRFMKRTKKQLRGIYYSAFKQSNTKEKKDEIIHDLNMNFNMLELICSDTSQEIDSDDPDDYDKIQPVLKSIEADLFTLKLLDEVAYHKYRPVYEDLKQQYSL